MPPLKIVVSSIVDITVDEDTLEARVKAENTTGDIAHAALVAAFGEHNVDTAAETQPQEA